MDKNTVDTSFITRWVRDWDSSISPELLSKVQDAYTAWYQEREPRHAVDDNNDLMSANNVVILGPTRDFQHRKVHKIFAENKTRGKLFGYGIDLDLPRFLGLSTLELGSFIGKPDLREFQDFGHREDLPNKDYLNRLFYDDYPLAFLAEELKNAGLNIPRNGKVEWPSDDYRRRDDLLRGLKDHVFETEKKRTGHALIKFVRGLNHKAYAIMRSARLDDGSGAGSHLSVEAYEWLSGCNESHDPNERKKIIPLRASVGDALRNRQDVGRMWGGLLEYIIDKKITKAIENNEPRIPLLTQAFGHWTRSAYYDEDEEKNVENIPTTPEFVRWLKGRNWEYFHGESKFQYERIVYGGFPVAAALPKEWRPRNAREWKAYNESYRVIGSIASLLERDISEVTLSLAHIFNRKSDYPDRVFKQEDTVQDSFVANSEDNNLQTNLGDFLSAIPAQLILPALVQEAQLLGYPMPDHDDMHEWEETSPILAQSNYSLITGHLARNIFRGMSVNDLAKFSNQWHQRLNRIQTRSMKLDGTYEWPALFKDTLTTKDGTVDMSCLTSAAELIYAGNEFKNCVGGYSYKCILGSSHIIQLENRETLEQALLEIKDSENDRGVFVVKKLQIEASSNKVAPPWAIAAADELIARINESDKIFNLKALNKERNELRKKIGRDALMVRAGFNPYNREYADNAYHVLHNEMREMFPEATRAQYLEARGITTQIPIWLKKQQGWHSPKI